MAAFQRKCRHRRDVTSPAAVVAWPSWAGNKGLPRGFPLRPREPGMSEQLQPPQHQDHQPGRENVMRPPPHYAPKYPGVGKLKGKVAIITGGDSGIGRAVAVAMAREGAKIAIVYLDEHKDANETRELVKQEGSQAFLLAGDVGDEDFCQAAVEATIEQFGRLDILVNNAAEQHETDDVREINAKQIERTFRTNVFSMFFMSKHALRHMAPGG